MKIKTRLFIVVLLIALGLGGTMNIASGEDNIEVNVGDLFSLGRVTFYVEEDIVWRIIAIKGDKALVISDAVKMDAPFSEDGEVTWEDSYVRQWLNNEFYYTAFTEDERELILDSEITTINSQNDQDETLLTDDYLFCLSVEEVEQYIPSPGYRNLTRIRDKRKAMDGIHYDDVFGQGWWLRTTSYGATNYWHDGVTFISTYRDQSVDYAPPQAKMDICPAFWAEIDSIRALYRRRAEETRLEEEERQRKAAEEDSPESLMSLIEKASGEKAVNRYVYDDFDGDGLNELFAFLGSKDDGYFGALTGDFWFSSVFGAAKLDINYNYYWGYEELAEEKLFVVYLEDYGEAGTPFYWTVVNGEAIPSEPNTEDNSDYVENEYTDVSLWVGRQLEDFLVNSYDWNLEDLYGEFGGATDSEYTIYVETKYGYVTNISVYDDGLFSLAGVHIGSVFQEAKSILTSEGWTLVSDTFDEGPVRCDYTNSEGYLLTIESVEDKLVDYMTIYIGDRTYEQIS